MNSDPGNLPQAAADGAKRGVVAVVVRHRRLLVIRRSQRVVAPGRLCFPGGAIEPGESEPQALVRELREELSVEIAPRRLLGRSVTPWNTQLAWWQAELALSAELIPNPAEVDSVHWLTRDELLEQCDLLDSNRHFLAAMAAEGLIL